MAQPQPVLVVTANLGADAVQYSSGNNPVSSYAKSVAQSLPGAVVCPTVAVTALTGAQTPLPASVFAAGSGVYAVFCDGGGNNDLSAIGSVSIVGGAIADSKGFFCSNVTPTFTVAQGPPVTVTTTWQLLDEVGAAGAYVPNIFQNVAAPSQVYNVQAIKLSSAPVAYLAGA